MEENALGVFLATLYLFFKQCQSIITQDLIYEQCTDISYYSYF